MLIVEGMILVILETLLNDETLDNVRFFEVNIFRAIREHSTANFILIKLYFIV